jgi:hypothetical protein
MRLNGRITVGMLMGTFRYLLSVRKQVPIKFVRVATADHV